MDFKRMLQQANKDVYAAIVLGVSVYNGLINVSAEDLLEVYYRLWKWNRKLEGNRPEGLVKIMEMYDEALKDYRQDIDAYLAAREKQEQMPGSEIPAEKKKEAPVEKDKVIRLFMFYDPNQLPS